MRREHRQIVPLVVAVAVVVTFKVNNANSGGDHYDVEFADEGFFFAIPWHRNTTHTN